MTDSDQNTENEEKPKTRRNVPIRMFTEEKLKYQAAAKIAGFPMAVWLRSIADKAADELLGS